MTHDRSATSSLLSALPNRPVRGEACGILLLLLAALIAAYWSTIVSLFKDWQADDNYSVGQLVPLAAIYLLWHSRSQLARCDIRPCWWGVVVILAAQAARLYGLVFMFESAERYSLVLTIIGLTLLVAGLQLFGRIFWILMFLFLMVPLPGQIHNLISGPLQEMASRGAVFILELIGLSVIREGNILLLDNQVSVAVAEACSGLRMLTAFVVVASVLAFVIQRPGWQKGVLVLSSVPVAIVCNLVRLVVTSLLYLLVGNQFAEKFFHDFAGWTMMPLAILILIGELWLMARLVTEEPHGSV